MRPWQVKGFVQDSDDEELDVIDTNQPSKLIEDHNFYFSSDVYPLHELSAISHDLDSPQAPNIPANQTNDLNDHRSTNRVNEKRIAHKVSGTSDGLDDLDELQQDNHTLSNTRLRTPEPVLNNGSMLRTDSANQHDALEKTPLGNEMALGLSDMSSPLSSVEEFELDFGPAERLFQVVIPIESNQGRVSQQDRQREAEAEKLRSFRPRKAIQLHPYAIEGERYRQSLKSRGIKPVYTASEVSKEKGGQDDTQNLETQRSLDDDFTYQDYDLPSSNHRNSSPIAMLSPHREETPAQHFLSPSSALNEDDDLPDIEDILKSKVNGEIRNGYKRRKISQNTDKRRYRTSITRRNGDYELGPVGRSKNSSVYDDPAVPSPLPHSRGPPNRPVAFSSNAKFRIPPGFSDSTLPTSTSSASKTRRNLRTIHSSDSDQDPSSLAMLNGRERRQTQPLTSLSDHTHSDTNSDASEVSRSSQLRRMQRKIKGVLPASWLKLDQQAQVKDRTGQEASTQRQEGGPQRGVAKKVVRPPQEVRNQTPSDKDAIIISDETEDDENHPILNSSMHPASPTLSPIEREPFNIDIGSFEAREEDWVDPMTTSATKTQGSRGRRNKRQTRLTDSFKPLDKLHSGGDKPKFTRQRPSHRGYTRERQVSSRPHKKRLQNVKNAVPKLSIVDAKETYDMKSNRQPRFIRVAARQARRQPNAARHSPTTKFIRLQTADDTMDANRTLDEWKTGALIMPHPVQDEIISQERQPLVARDINHQQQPSSSNRSSRSPININKEIYTRLLPRGIPVRQFRKDHMLLQRKLYPESDAKNSKKGATVTKKRQDGIKTTRNPSFRIAQLEGLESEFEAEHRRSAFQRELNQPGRDFLAYMRNGKLTRSIQLAKFLLEDGSGAIPPPEEPMQLDNGTPPLNTKTRPGPGPEPHRRSRKRVAKRVDAECRKYRQPVEPIPNVSSRIDHDALEDNEHFLLQGLGGTGTRYSTNFDIFPLQLGTFFHLSTLIGSGDLEESLSLSQKDLDISRAPCTIDNFGEISRCGSWDESVASAITAGFESLSTRITHPSSMETDHELEPQTTENLSKCLVFCHSLMCYFSKSISFIDPIDRRSAVPLVTELLTRSSSSLASILCNITWRNNASVLPFLTRILVYHLIIFSQILQIGRHTCVDAADISHIQTAMRATSKCLISHLLNNGMSELRGFLDENQRYLVREAGIRQEKYFIELVVAVQKILQYHDMAECTFWGLTVEVLLPKVKKESRVPVFENIWYDIFTLLPYGEFDGLGVLVVGSRFQLSTQNWSLIKSLISRLLELYPQSSRNNLVSLNLYLRAVFTRCYNLIQFWGWCRCETVMGTIFDFFAGRNLANLHLEESKGSPRFLELLDTEPSLEIEPDDRAFHIFLKTLAVGLRAMPYVYSAKKIFSIAWRFIPNHGRTYRKDEAIMQKDLDSLRNNHDLLCTLYWSCPPGYRPKVDSIQMLVDHSTSHREACRLSVYTWARLVRFQISTSESESTILPFALWLKEIIDQSIKQYRLARIEAEAQFDRAQTEGNNIISQDILKATIKSNQNKVIATLSDAMNGLKHAIRSSKSKVMVNQLLQQSEAIAVVKQLDCSNIQHHGVFIELLEVIQEYIRLYRHYDSHVVHQQQSNEESQDYGEWPDMDEKVDEISDVSRSEPLNEMTFVHDQLWHLLSNAFGAEKVPDERLLCKVIDTWIMLALYITATHQKEWRSYLDAYNTYSWYRLRNSEQTRKYTSYFIALIIEADPNSYEQNKLNIIVCWLESLVERESLLKFQHRLTTALLNTEPCHPLFQNLPFHTGDDGTKYYITLKEFRERRLGLISSVLANMRNSFEVATRARSPNTGQLRREYASILKQLMTVMKAHYQEFQKGSSIRGAYVEFVQQVVEFLQQYTRDICSVDRFFTDALTFPVPISDPSYVVGHLKGYALGLNDPGTIKKLDVFIRTVSKRAAIDNQQAHLAQQLFAAMSNTYESGSVTRPTLRRAFAEVILPAYLENAFPSPTGWILAAPMLKSARRMIVYLLYDSSMTDANSVESVSFIIFCVFSALYKSVQLPLHNRLLLNQPHVQYTLSLVFKLATATFPLIDYLERSVQQPHPAEKLISFFHSFGSLISDVLTGQYVSDEHYAFTFDFPNDPLENRHPFSDIRVSCARELSQSLASNWIAVDDPYQLMRGSIRKAQNESVESPGDERGKLKKAIDKFKQGLGVLTGFNDVLCGDEAYRASSVWTNEIRAGGYIWSDEVGFGNIVI